MQQLYSHKYWPLAKREAEKKKESKLSFCYHHHSYLKVTILIISRTFPWLYRPFPVAFSLEELKCWETAALSRIKLVLSKAHFILTTASGCIDASMKPRLGISLPELQVHNISSQQIIVAAQTTKALFTQHFKLEENLVILWNAKQWCHNRCSVITVQLRYVIDFYLRECVVLQWNNLETEIERSQTKNTKER